MASDADKAARPPAGLGKTGRALWRAVTRDVAPGWQLDARDLANLEAACRAADRAAELDAVVDRDGPMTNGSTGQPVVNPAVSEARQQRALISTLLGRVELAPPREKTGGLSQRQRDQLADARRRRRDRPHARAAREGG